MTSKPINVLFLCTGNSARSIMAEAVLNELGDGRFKAFSAGSHPTGTVNPFALQTLAGAGISTDGLASKSWDEFATPYAPHLDIVVTVCNNAAGETCPIWYSAPVKVHWGFDDPAAAVGPDVAKLAAARLVFAGIHQQIRKMITVDFAGMTPQQVLNALQSISPPPSVVKKRA